MIDLDRKIIFLHPPKTGGTTIESAFKWHPKYVINQPKYWLFFKRFKHASLQSQIRGVEALGFSEKEFFKFVCVRNPWDIAVSWYYFDKAREVIDEALPFETFIFRKCKGPNFLNIFPYINYKNNMYVDYVIRYENYKEDAERVFDKYDVTWNEHFHVTSRPRNTPYQDLYTPKTKTMVEEKAKSYIDMFEYSF